MSGTTRALLVLTAVLAWTQTGYQYYCTPSTDNDPSTCTPVKQIPLRWYRTEVPVQMDQALCGDMTSEDALVAIRQSLQTWNAEACTHPRLVDLGLVSGKVPIVKVKGGEVGNDLIIFQNTQAEWMADKADVNVDSVIALTTLFYDPTTGEARSYALEFNDWWYTFGVLQGTERVAATVDLENTLTHELGHVLALDHSQDRESTMFYSAPLGETRKRSLEQDDRTGLCSLYSVAYAEVNPDAEIGGGGDGCSSHPAGVPAVPSNLAPLLLALAALAAGRSRKRRHGSP
jgi:MYXO-CTERM domain-containing protein